MIVVLVRSASLNPGGESCVAKVDSVVREDGGIFSATVSATAKAMIIAITITIAKTFLVSTPTSNAANSRTA